MENTDNEFKLVVLKALRVLLRTSVDYEDGEEINNTSYDIEFEISSLIDEIRKKQEMEVG